VSGMNEKLKRPAVRETQTEGSNKQTGIGASRKERGTWVLGVSDPEMQLIEAMLRDVGEAVVHAKGRNGKRVRATTAYDFPWRSKSSSNLLHFVECEPDSGYPAGALVIDHHGDRQGNITGSEDLSHPMTAGSLGQVIRLLAAWDRLPAPWERTEVSGDHFSDGQQVVFDGARWLALLGPDRAHGAVIPEDIVLAAASDHALTQAYQGEFAGVDPQALGQWRAESRARFQERPVRSVLEDVHRAKEAIRSAGEVLIGGLPVRDLRAVNLSEAPEAAARLGVPLLYGPLSERDGREKYGILGAPPEVVRIWLAGNGPVDGLTGLYGDEERGYAGGYRTRTEEDISVGLNSRPHHIPIHSDRN